MSARLLAAAAAGLVGVPYLLHGRDPAMGLDCLGVLAASLGAIGRPAPLPFAYTLRTRSTPDLAPIADACGLVPATDARCEGDVLLVRPGACQLHLLVSLTPVRFVHAHAGLRRVVLFESGLPWPVVAAWRLADHS